MKKSGMAKDPVVQMGDPVLKRVALPVAKKDITGKRIKALIKHMKDVLRHEDFGVAIAAPQVGESLRIFVIAGKAFVKETPEAKQEILEKKSGGTPEERVSRTFSKEFSAQPDKVFINPEITKLSKKKVEMSEGCLSVRHKYGAVLRHERAAVRALDESGKPFVYNGSGLLGHIFQHEVDHLNGILYTQRAVRVEEDENWEKLAEKRRTK